MKVRFVIGCLFTMGSCGFGELLQKNEDYPLPADKRSNMQQNTVLVYENNLGETDTLYCVLKIDGTYRWALSGTSSKDPAAYWEFQAFYLSKSRDSSFLIQNDLWYYDNYYITTVGEGASGDLPSYDNIIRLTIGLYDRPRKESRDFSPQVDWYNVNANGFIEKDFLSSFESNNNLYKDVYVYSPNTNVNSDLKYLYVNKDMGIIKYELLNGTIWFLK